MAHHVSVTQSSEARLLDALAAVVPRPGLKAVQSRGLLARRSVRPPMTKRRCIGPHRLMRVKLVSRKQAIKAQAPRRFTIAFARGDLRGDCGRASRGDVIRRSNRGIDKMPLSEMA
jgi:hypothetical protein